MQINIESKIKNYSINISSNFDFLSQISQISPSIIIIDKNVWSLYENIFTAYFDKNQIILFEAIEANKTIDSVLSLCDSVIKSNAKKNITLVSFGGGIVQDVSGFLASILYRGINWIFVPTTLLAQADSCMGSKTSLNFKSFKNLIGSFFPPSKIYVNVEFAKTLKNMDLFSGIGEVVKLHLMGGKDNIDLISKKIKEVQSSRNNTDFITELVKNSLSIKYSYIKDDEFDTGRRNLLNYGHCFGHALEVASDYVVPHGTAVVIGIIFANLIAVKREILSQEKEILIREGILLHSYDFQFQRKFFDKDIILSALKMDKKRVGDGLPLITMQENWELIRLIDMTPEELCDGIDSILNILKIK